MVMYGIPNCDTVKKARTFLQDHSIEFTFVDFKKSPPTAKNIAAWEKAFGGLPVNKSGQTFKKFKSQYEAGTKAEQVSLIIENPSMIKRPILEKSNKDLLFGFDAAEYLKLV